MLSRKWFALLNLHYELLKQKCPDKQYFSPIYYTFSTASHYSCAIPVPKHSLLKVAYIAAGTRMANEAKDHYRHLKCSK